MASRDHALYCFYALDQHLHGKSIKPYDGPDSYQEYPLFITWNILRSSGNTRLRGCIGSFAALPLQTGLKEYALTAALRDRRFSPISKAELSKLECGVSLLTDFEDVEDPYDWELGVHGIYIHFTDPATIPKQPPPVIESPATPSSVSTSATASGTASVAEEPDKDTNTSTLRSKLNSLSDGVRRKASLLAGGKVLSATYLPDVATSQGWNQTETLESAIHKAGYHGTVTEDLIQSLRVTRYQSSKVEVSYSEWQESKD